MGHVTEVGVRLSRVSSNKRDDFFIITVNDERNSGQVIDIEISLEEIGNLISAREAKGIISGFHTEHVGKYPSHHSISFVTAHSGIWDKDEKKIVALEMAVYLENNIDPDILYRPESIDLLVSDYRRWKARIEGKSCDIKYVVYHDEPQVGNVP
jgi:hypothetical protein